MAPPHHPKSNKPFVFNPAGTEKHARFEDVPDEEMPSVRPKNIFGPAAQPRGEARHGHPSGEAHRVPVHQPKEGGDRAHSLEAQRVHAAQKPTQDKKPEKKSQEKAPAETHEQFSAPGVGATPQTVGVFLHTSANPAMALGYTQGYSTLPYQATTQAVPGANIVTTPSNGHTYYHLPSQDPGLGANPALNTTYIGTRNMTYSRDNDFQYGAPHNPQGLHFQPPVPDTTYGPMTHTYVPRQDAVVPQVAAVGAPVQVCYPYYAAHVPVATRPAAHTALVPVAHASIMPSGTFYASRLIRAAPFALFLWYLFGWELEVLAWVVALLYLLWLLVSDVHCRAPRGRVAIVNAQSSQVPLQPQVTPGHTLTVHHQAPVPTFQPQIASQPVAYFGGQAMPGSYPAQPAQFPPMYAAAPAFPGVPGVPGVPGSVTAHLPPDVTGVGKTIDEIQAHYHNIAMTNGILEPEDFQPASKDPAKMYYCRELDGNWTQRSRYSIDKMGDWRWYQTPEGAFYAVRLPN